MCWNHQPVNHFQDHNLGGIPVYLEKWRLIIDTVTDSAFSLGTWKWPIYDSSWRCPLESRQAPSPSWRPLALPFRRHGSLVKEPVAMLRMLIESEQVHQAGWFPLESGFQFMLTSSSSSPPSALFVCPTFRKGHSNIFQPLLRIPVFLWCIPTSKKKKQMQYHIHQRREFASISGWWFGTWLLFCHILGMSSSQLTIFFQRGRSTTKQIYFEGHPALIWDGDGFCGGFPR